MVQKMTLKSFLEWGVLLFTLYKIFPLKDSKKVSSVSENFDTVLANNDVINNVMDDSLPRGLRNNNPGNIKFSSNNNWQGEMGSDGTFSQFKSMGFGLRAMIKLIRKYYYTYGLKTVPDIIGRWSATDRVAYSNFVLDFMNEQSSGFKPTTVLNISDDNTFYFLLKAMVYFENGKDGITLGLFKYAKSLL